MARMPEPTIEAPRFVAVGDRAVLVEFGRRVDDAAHDAVLALDRSAAELPGVVETVPAYVGLLVVFDPLATDHDAVIDALGGLARDGASREAPLPARRVVQICYEDDLGADLPAVAAATGRSVDAVVDAHLAGDYRVVMYGFAPGSAYLSGVPASIRVPRRETAAARVTAGGVIVAGPQCLVVTTEMPTGWWVIGRSPTPIMRPHDPQRPFLFDPGDTVVFERIDRATYDAQVPR